MAITTIQARKQSALVSLVIMLFLVVGCATTKAELMSNTDNMQVWDVGATIDEVFRTYKDCAEEKLSGGDILWSGGRRVRGYFYGPNAELSIKMEGNPLAQITYLHFEFDKSLENTVVKVWYYDGGWQVIAETFKTLFPTKEVSSP